MAKWTPRGGIPGTVPWGRESRSGGWLPSPKTHAAGKGVAAGVKSAGLWGLMRAEGVRWGWPGSRINRSRVAGASRGQCRAGEASTSAVGFGGPVAGCTIRVGCVDCPAACMFLARERCQALQNR